jgi:hypothetical protein
VRWGWFVGRDPVAYTGLGYPQFADYESGRGIEQLDGRLPPLAVGADGGYVLNQRPAPETSGERAWPGASGAAVFCQGLLTAVVVKDDRAFGNRRLHAVPAHTLIADPEFVHLIMADTGVPPVPEAVELTAFMQPPGTSVLARTPGSLLAATVEAVPFTGRTTELGELTGWRDRPQPFSVMLVAGEGGQGKTRLAREFASRARHAGWAAGFLAVRKTTVARDNSGPLQATMGLARQVREAIRPVVLIADYAETWPEEVAALTDALLTGPLSEPVRLLLLSRTAGAWWAGLTDILGPDFAHRIDLLELTDTTNARREAYIAAAIGLAQHLAVLPDPPTGQEPQQPWSVLAERLARQSRALDAPRFGNALTLQMTALTDLLGAASAGDLARLSEREERELVLHERAYLRRAAAKRRLFRTGVLSDRADDDERAAEVWAALERALAGTILLGPCDASQARAIGLLVSANRESDVVSWLATLYPPSSGKFTLGTVQPDRLAELLLGPILTQQADALGQISTLANTIENAYAALFTLVRTAAHPGFGQVSEQIRDLVSSHPQPFAVAASALAVVIPKPDLLQNALIHLGRLDPRSFKSTAYEAVNQLPMVSVSAASFSVALTTVMTNILRALARDSPDVYLPNLATSLNNLGIRLAAAGQPQAALAPTQEAVDTYHELAKANPGTYLPDLATALNNLGVQMAAAGQRSAAFLPTQEAVTIRRQLAEAKPSAYLPDLATSLNNLGNQLTEAGQRQAGLAPTQEAVDNYRQLVEANPDAYLPSLATALNNLGVQLAEARQWQLALAASQEAADAYRQLVEANPDTYLPGLATALNNLGNRLAAAGQPQAALVTAQESVTLRRRLAEANPDAYRSDLATALNNLGNRLAAAGQPQAALTAAQEAADTYRQLVKANPGAHLANLATSLKNLSNHLVEAGRQSEADAIWESVIGTLSEDSSRLTLTVAYAQYLLGRSDPGASVDVLTRVLITPEIPRLVEATARRLQRDQWRQHPQAVERAWQSARVTSLPDWMYLSDDHFTTVVRWINARTWAESRDYFQDNFSQLLSPTTITVLDELALTALTELIALHKVLLEAVREYGLDAVYRPLLHAGSRLAQINLGNRRRHSEQGHLVPCCMSGLSRNPEFRK